MPCRPKLTLLAQGKPRTLGGRARPWREQLYAPEAGGTRYQIMFRALAGDGAPWERVLRRAACDEEARKIFKQAERALDTAQGIPVGADVRGSRTIRMLGEEYLEDCRKRGKQPRTMDGRRSRLDAHIVPTIGDVPVTTWRIQHSRAVMEKGPATLHFPVRPRGPARPTGGDAQGGVAPGLARPLDRPLEGLNIGYRPCYTAPRPITPTRGCAPRRGRMRAPTRPTNSAVRLGPTLL